MSSSQLYHVFSNLCGMILMEPSFTAFSAFLPMPSVFTNHWEDTRGSMISPPRWDRGTLCMCGSTLSASDSSSISAHSLLRASNRSRDSYDGPQFAFIVASLFRMLMMGRSYLRERASERSE
jgi:hypothetical protein